MKNSFFSSTLGRFRLVAIMEGVSFLVLLGIAMPLKYFADMPLAVKYIGWLHGLLFVLYMVLFHFRLLVGLEFGLPYGSGL